MFVKILSCFAFLAACCLLSCEPETDLNALDGPMGGQVSVVKTLQSNRQFLGKWQWASAQFGYYLVAPDEYVLLLEDLGHAPFQLLAQFHFENYYGFDRFTVDNVQVLLPNESVKANSQIDLKLSTTTPTEPSAVGLPLKGSFQVGQATAGYQDVYLYDIEFVAFRLPNNENLRP